jgi:Mg2+ and Co2+ transporter CorA
MTETKVKARLLTDSGWRYLAADEDFVQLIAESSRGVWVDIFADPDDSTVELRRLSSCPQLAGVDAALAAKGGEYPPWYPPKAKAFGESIFARAYWLGATDSSHEIRAQEVHILAGKRFAITLRYPLRSWDMAQKNQKEMSGDRCPGEDGLRLPCVEKNMAVLNQRRGRPRATDEAAAVQGRDSFGLELAIAVLDEIIDSVFESLNAIRLIADRLEANVVEGAVVSGVRRQRLLGRPRQVAPGADGTGSKPLSHETLNIRRLLRQVRWSFLPSDEISELRSGPFLDLDDSGVELRLEDLCREADRAIETVREVIQQVQQVVELSTTLETERLNRTIYVLTIAATVLLIPTLIAGIWGMNFHPIPGTGTPDGFWLALLALVVLSGSAAVAIRWFLRWYLRREEGSQ